MGFRFSYLYGTPVCHLICCGIRFMIYGRQQTDGRSVELTSLNNIADGGTSAHCVCDSTERKRKKKKQNVADDSKFIGLNKFNGKVGETESNGSKKRQREYANTKHVGHFRVFRYLLLFLSSSFLEDGGCVGDVVLPQRFHDSADWSIFCQWIWSASVIKRGFCGQWALHQWHFNSTEV